jgi:hypothetical protein
MKLWLYIYSICFYTRQALGWEAMHQQGEVVQACETTRMSVAKDAKYSCLGWFCYAFCYIFNCIPFSCNKAVAWPCAALRAKSLGAVVSMAKLAAGPWGWVRARAPPSPTPTHHATHVT